MLVRILDEQALKNQNLLNAVRWLRSIKSVEFFLLNDAVWFVACVIWCLCIEILYRLQVMQGQTPERLSAVNKKKNERIVIPVVACALGDVFTSLAVLYATSSTIIILQSTGFLLLEMCVILPLFFANDKHVVFTAQENSRINASRNKNEDA